MKIARPSIAVVCTALVLVAGHAEAATKKPVKKKAAPKPVSVCNLVTDPSGDANGVNVQQPPAPTLPTTTAGSSTDAMDITSVDVAADKNNITGVMRVKKLVPTASSAPTGINWSINFTVNKTTFTVSAHASALGAITYDASYATAAGGSIYGPMQGVFDTAKNEIHVTLPISAMGKQEAVPLGTKITAINGVTGPEILVPEATGKLGGGTFFSDTYNFVDWTKPGKDYTTGTLSCVTPGK